MKYAILLLLSTSVGCAALGITGEDVLLASQRACAALEVAAEDPLIDEEKLAEYRLACRMARALAGLPPLP